MKMHLSRRKFIMMTTGLGAGFLLLKSKELFHIKHSASGIIVGGGQGLIDGQLVQYLALVDLNQSPSEPLFYRLNFLAHGLATHPQKPHLRALFQKKGPHACELNLETGHVERMITTDPSRYFYGHGSYSIDGNHLYTTETILNSEEGVIVQRNSQTMALEDLFPTYGANPHDCQLVENGTVLAITNGGKSTGLDGIPCVSYVDVKSRKLIRQHKMVDSRYNTGHLLITQGKQLIVASAPHPRLPFSDPGALSIVASDGTLKNLNTDTLQAHLKSETLSLCVDEGRRIIAATSPAGNSVTFWSLDSNELVSSLDLPNPRGIILTADARYYAISFGPNSDLVLVDAETRTKTELQVLQAGFSGSHLYLI